MIWIPSSSSLLLLLLLIAILVYIGAPLAHYLRFWTSPAHAAKASPLESLPPDVVSSLTSQFPALAALGFRCSVHVDTLVSGSAANCHLSLWINDLTFDTVRVLVLCLRPSGRRIVSIVFEQEYTDGTSIMTGTSSGPSAGIATPSSLDALGLRGLDLPHVFAVHQHRTTTRRAHRTPVLPNDPIAHLNATGNQITDYHVSLGLLRFDPATRRYRPTLKGAFLTAWAILWPMSRIHTRRRNANVHAVLREMGYRNLDHFRQTPLPAHPAAQPETASAVPARPAPPSTSTSTT